MPDTSKEPKFSKIREVFFPIHKNETKKVLLVSSLFACVLFVYTFIRAFKYTFIQKYAVCGGAELIPAIKLFFVVPTIILILFLFETLTDKFGREKTFCIAISAFAIFFASFVLFMFPNRDFIHASPEFIEKMRGTLPGFCYYIIPCITNWSFTLFYLTTEVWGGFVVPVLFWQFANQITSQSEVKRFLGVYSCLGHIGVVFAGTWIEEMSKVKEDSILNQNIMIAIGISVAFCFLIILIYKYITKNYAKNIDINMNPAPKEKISLFKGIKVLFTSRYVFCITVVLLSYYITSDLVEVTWQGFLNLHSTRIEYSKMMGLYFKLSGISAIVFSLLTNFMLQKFKWKYAAIVTPAIILIIGGAFFTLHLYSNAGGQVFEGLSVVQLVVFLGLLTMVLMKGAKFTLFDITRNMAYRPLDEESKAKGQATAEMLGSKFGKSASSGINYTLTNLIVAGSKVGEHLLIIIPLIGALLVFWIKSIFAINKNYEQFQNK